MKRQTTKARTRELLVAGIAAAQDSVLVTDSEGRILTWNQGCQILFGFCDKEVIGESVARLYPFPPLFPPADRPGASLRYRSSMLGKDGQVFSAEVTCTGFESQHLGPHFVFVVRDITDVKGFEEQLLKSEARCRILLESMPQGVLFLNREGRITFANPSACRLLGITQRSGNGAVFCESGWPMIREDGTQIVHDENPSMRALVSGKPIRDVVTGILNPEEGTQRWLRVNSFPLFRGRDTSPSEVYTVLEDITEQKNAHEKLCNMTRELRGRNKEIQCLYEVMSLLHDVGFAEFRERLPRVISRIAEGFRFPALTGACLKTRDMEIATPDFRETRCQLRSLIAAGANSIGELVVSCLEEPPESQQEFFLSEERELLNALGRVIGEALSRCESEKQLEKQERFFRALTEKSTELVSIIGADSTILYMSPASAVTLGCAPDEWVGRKAPEMVHPDDVSRLNAVLETAGVEGSVSAVEQFRFRQKDGTWRHMESVGTNLLQDPVIQGIILNSRDITERKHLELKYLHSQKLEALGQLAAGVAHDFNNLLTIIQGNTDFLAGSLEEGSPQQSEALEISYAARRAATMTRQLLAFGRRQILRVEAFHPNQMIQDLERMLKRLIGVDIELTTELGSFSDQIRADRGQIEQVLLNLAVNAKDAMPNGGSLLLKTRSVDLNASLPERQSGVPPGSYVVLEVTDNGQGMPPETLRRLFEPFFTTKEQGTGLGLATVYGIVRQGGGQVTVSSQVGKGSTFSVFLPSFQPTPPDLSSVAEDPAVIAEPKRATILVVEDEAGVRKMLRKILEREEFDVIEASDGPTAMTVVQDHSGPIDLIISDLVMPRMGGLEAREQILKLRASLEFLFMSGHTEDEGFRKDAGLTLIPFLQKPFTGEDLLAKVRGLLRRS